MLNIKAWVANFRQLSKKQKIIIVVTLILSIILLIVVFRQNTERFGMFYYPSLEQTTNLQKENLVKKLAWAYYSKSSDSNLFSYKPNDYLAVYKIKVTDSNLDAFIKNNQFVQVPNSDEELIVYKSDTLGCYLYKYAESSDIECTNSPLSLDVTSIFPGLNITKMVNGEDVTFLENDKEVYLASLRGFIDLRNNSLIVSNWNFTELASSNYETLSVAEALFAYANVNSAIGIKINDTDLKVCSGEGCSNLEYVDFAHPESMDLTDVKLVYLKTESVKDTKSKYLIPYYKLSVKGAVTPNYPSHWPDDYIKTLPTEANIYYDIFVPTIKPNYLVVAKSSK